MINRVIVHPILQFKPTSIEAGKLSRLMRRLNKLQEDYGDFLSMSQSKYLEYSNKRASISAELDGLAAEIGKRTVGELPLTLRTDWTDQVGLNPTVVLNIKVSSFSGGQYEWRGEGVRLRNDGSVGVARGEVRLDNKQVWRRQLDGEWTPLVPQSKKLER